jgi:CRP-like cAMP-binding protein
VSGARLGRAYAPGEVVLREGDEGDSLFVVLDGEFEVVKELQGRETVLRVCGKDEIFGEMAVFERTRRSATVRARTRARALTLDRQRFMRRLQEDPTLAWRLMEVMSRRIRELSSIIAELRKTLSDRGLDRP